MGPFVSSQHSLIVSGNVDASPEYYFKKCISEKLPNEIQILLVPSLQDIVHETTVLPQPGFGAKMDKKDEPPVLGLDVKVSHHKSSRNSRLI